MALKRKKKYEKTLLQLDGTLTTLETEREYLQNASTNMDVLHVIEISSYLGVLYLRHPSDRATTDRVMKLFNLK
jgi:hypothetical protein